MALIKLDAVLGVKGQFDSDGSMRTMGISCALCHSTVDDAFAPGIGRRLDGWANRDLDVGLIVSLAPDLTAVQNLLGVDRETLNTVLRSWGPGEFDAEVILDGKAFRPDGMEVVERVALEVEPHEGFAQYLRTKRERMGHLIRPARRGAGVNTRGR